MLKVQLLCIAMGLTEDQKKMFAIKYGEGKKDVLVYYLLLVFFSVLLVPTSSTWEKLV